MSKNILLIIHNPSRYVSNTQMAKVIGFLSKQDIIVNPKLKEFFLDRLEPAQFGKYQINIDDKNLIIEQCVDEITKLYSLTTGEKND